MKRTAAKKEGPESLGRREALLGERQAGARINGGERFEPRAGFRYDSAAHACGFRDERGEKGGRHRRQVDRQQQQTLALHPAQRRHQSAERPAARRLIGHDRHARARVRAIAATGDEKFRGIESAQRGELALPERFAVDEHAGFVAAHARGFSSGEEDGGEGRQ